jgi:hypothetical protein
VDDGKDEKDSRDYVVPAHFVGCVTQTRRCRLFSSQCERSVCSVVKTKRVVAKSRINENELKMERVMNWGIESEGKGTRTIQYPVKLR